MKERNERDEGERSEQCCHLTMKPVECYIRIPMRHGVSPFIYVIFLACLCCSTCANQASYAGQDRIDQVLKKKDLTVVVTDSGLGGLSITAEAVKRMQTEQSFQKIEFIFFNALFSNQGGYNSLGTRKEKLAVFNSALNAMQQRYSPDIILIGCNTLSVLFPDTAFARHAKVPAVGIVDAGVDLISEKLKSRPDSRVIIFGTHTTIAEGVHERKLQKKGFLDERIVTHSCPELVSFIERGYNSSETEMLIYAYVDEALRELKESHAPFFVSFNCTHYGYAQPLWEKAFKELGRRPLAYLNPNPRMIEFLFPLEKLGAYSDIQVAVRVVSMVEIPKETQNSLSRLLTPVSQATAAALKNYQLIPDLYEWEKYVEEAKSLEGIEE